MKPHARSRHPAGQPIGGQFSEGAHRASGLSLPPEGPLPVLPDKDAAALGEVDLGFHPADLEWDELSRNLNAEHDSSEDPTYDPDGPWYGENEQLAPGVIERSRRAA